jgi:hypothetical protein
MATDNKAARERSAYDLEMDALEAATANLGELLDQLHVRLDEALAPKTKIPLDNPAEPAPENLSIMSERVLGLRGRIRTLTRFVTDILTRLDI